MSKIDIIFCLCHIIDMTLHISLPKKLEELVHEQVNTGLYGSASEVVREALRRMLDIQSEWDVLDAEILQRLKALQSGEAKIAGEGLEFLKNIRDTAQ